MKPKNPSKTNYIAAILAIQILGVHFVPLASAQDVPRGRAVNTAQSISALQQVANLHQIQITTFNARFPVVTSYGKIDGKVADHNALGTYVPLFVNEFTLYPPTAIRRAKLKEVVLCEQLSFSGQARAAIPDYEHDTLYLDVSCGAYDTKYERKVLHHEFFHIIDYMDDGFVYEDERWAALNPPNHVYGQGGISVQHIAETSLLTKKFPGFLNHYSTTGVEEDKAELFANLMVEFNYVEARAKQDKVLRDKVNLMRQLLVKFCPELDANFWRRASLLKRKDN